MLNKINRKAHKKRPRDILVFPAANALNGEALTSRVCHLFRALVESECAFVCGRSLESDVDTP